MASARLAGACAALAAAVGITILAGWMLDNATLRNGLSGNTAVNPVGAIFLLLAAVAIWMFSRDRSSLARRIGLACGAAIVVIGTARMLGPMLGISPDALAILSGVRWSPGPGSLPAKPITGGSAILYILIGIGLLQVTSPRDGWRTFARSIGLFLALIGALVLFAALAALADGTGAAGRGNGLPVTLGFLAVAVGMIVTGPDRKAHGFEDAGGFALRRRVNLALVVAVSIIVLTGGVTIWSASRSQSADKEREASWTRRVQLSLLLSTLQSAAIGERESAPADHLASLKRVRSSVDTLPGVLRRTVELFDSVRTLRPGLDSLRGDVEQTTTLFSGSIGLEEAGRHEDAMALLRQGSGRAGVDRIQDRIARLSAIEDSLSAQLKVGMRRDNQISLTTGLLAALLAISFLILAGVAINADLQKRGEAESALRQSEARLAQIVDLLPSMVFLKEPVELRFVRLNKAGEDLLGYPRDALMGKNDFDFFPEDEARRFIEHDRRVLEGTEVMDIPEEAVHTRTKGIRLLHTKKVAVRDERGAPLFLLGISEDITEQKRADQAMREAKDSAENANRAKSDFLAKMSHELRTPLNSIIGFSEILEDESAGGLNEKQRRYVSNVLLSGRNLLQLINDILDLAKVEAGRIELDIAEFDARTAVDQVRSIVAALADKKGVRVYLSAPDDLPAIAADQPKFKQIMFNLLGNAIKFTPAGGRIEIDLRMVGTRDDATGIEWLTVSVADTGIGIAAADLNRIFGEFEQVASSVGGQQGTGLGLALTRKLVELHGGRVWVESEVGKGSTFHFTIPCSARRGQVVARPRNEADPAVDPDRPLILIIDNDAGAQDLIAVFLRESGYGTVCASTGEEAVRLAQTLSPAAITLDMLLPDRDGLLILAQLKSNPLTRKIPVVVVSVTDRRELGFSLGAADWLVKPISRAALGAALERTAPHPSRPGKPTILVVDDEAPTLDYLSELIQGWGFNVVCAEGGRAGVDLALRIQPDLILLDLMMPDLNGFDVVRTLRQHPLGEYIPILILTAMDLTVEDGKRLGLSVQAVIAKGGKEQLLAELTRICPSAAIGTTAAR